MLEQTAQPAWQGVQLASLSTHPDMHKLHIEAIPIIEQLEHPSPQLVKLLQVPFVRVWPAGQEVHNWLLLGLHVAQLDEQGMQVLLAERTAPAKQVKHVAGLLGEHCQQLLEIVHFEQTPGIEPK